MAGPPVMVGRIRVQYYLPILMSPDQTQNLLVLQLASRKTMVASVIALGEDASRALAEDNRNAAVPNVDSYSEFFMTVAL